MHLMALPLAYLGLRPIPVNFVFLGLARVKNWAPHPSQVAIILCSDTFCTTYEGIEITLSTFVYLPYHNANSLTSFVSELRQTRAASFTIPSQIVSF